MIRASVSCDDDTHGPVIEFDATAWFENASDSEIQCMRDEDFYGGEASDSVAEYLAERNEELAEFFRYLSFRQKHCQGSCSGYSVRVNSDDAESWLAERAGRPERGNNNKKGKAR